MRRSAQFATTVRRGQRSGSRALMVHVAVPSHPGTSPAGPEVGFVVGRGIGPAVVRNRVRRRLRHLVGARLTRLPAGATVVVRAHPSAAALSSAQLGAELDQVLDRALHQALAKAAR